MILGQDCSYSKVRGVSGDSKGKCWVRNTEYRGCCHAIFQLFKGFLGGSSPIEGGILIGEVSEGSSDLGVILDKSMIIIA